jgi:hypothetical protein
MARPTLEPISVQTLPEFACFLEAHMPVRRDAQDWQRCLQPPWSHADSGENFGYLLRDQGRVVGGIGAYYGERRIRGSTERFCNITSWCVLDAYRQQSVRLAMALLGQTGLHFTNFSPTTIVASTLKFLKFKELDGRTAVVLNLPWPGPLAARVISSRHQIEDKLEGEARRNYRDHADLPWLRHLLVGSGSRWCHVIYKRRLFKGLPAAHLLHVENSNVLQSNFRCLANHLLRLGMVTTHVELRLLAARPPWPFAIRTGFNPKLYRSAELTEADINYLYSETLALDL